MNQDKPSGVIYIDPAVLASGDLKAAMAFAAEMLRAVADAHDGSRVTYVVSRGDVIASVSPPEAGERYEHANEVMVQARSLRATMPVQPARRHRRFRGWSPFEGLF